MTDHSRWRRGLTAAGLLCSLLAGREATAVSVCVLATTPVVFANYDPFYGAGLTASGTLTVSCSSVIVPTGAVAYTLSLSASQTTGTMARAMGGAFGGRLLYNLYTDASRTVIWGNGSSGTQTVAGSVTPIVSAVPAIRVHTVYGSLPMRQSVRTGLYTDTIYATINY